jgi:hypothetical protein
VNVNESDYYTFFSKSDMDTYGYLYKDNFNPNIPYINVLAQNDGDCDNDQFMFTVALESNITYILVVTTYYSDITGAFSVVASGPKNVSLKGNNEYISMHLSLTTKKISERKSCHIYITP